MTDEYDDETQSDGILIGYRIGEPSAFSSDCDFTERQPGKPGTGCTAVIRCSACQQLFRVDLMSQANQHVCPNEHCRKCFTSLLIVAAVDDDEILQDVFEHLAEVNGERANNPDDAEPDVEVDEPAIPESAGEPQP